MFRILEDMKEDQMIEAVWEDKETKQIRPMQYCLKFPGIGSTGQ
jgi:hypothetical protein